MDTTGPDISILEVPRDDGTIHRAIDDLEQKINAWVDAVADAQRIVEKLAQVELRSAVSPTASPADADPAPQAARPVAEATAPAASVAETSVKDDGKKKGLRLDHLTNKPPAKPSPKKGITVYEDVEVEVAAPKTPQDTTEEDEALLATLDPKLAKQIRIRRRLGNGKKSVRQLLDEGIF